MLNAEGTMKNGVGDTARSTFYISAHKRHSAFNVTTFFILHSPFCIFSSATRPCGRFYAIRCVGSVIVLHRRGTLFSGTTLQQADVEQV